MSIKLAMDLWFSAIENGGGTFGHRSGEPYDGEGYVVGGFTETLELRQETRTIEAIEAIAKWLDKNISVYVGSWVHDGKVYVDGCDIRIDRDDAIKLGKILNQIAIFDVKEGREILLEEEREEAGS